MSDIFIIGGPNGAGKTTAAKKLLPKYLGLDVYLNADEIARRISPQDVDAAAFKAGRIMLERMRSGAPLEIVYRQKWQRIQESLHETYDL